MARPSKLEWHRPSDSGAPVICLHDHEDWPCTVQQVRDQVAAEIDAAVQADQAYRPKWVNGMTDAAALARGPHGA